MAGRCHCCRCRWGWDFWDQCTKKDAENADHVKGEAKRVGLTMQEAHVLIFGNPKGGTPLMIASPLLALDLPLKVLVWQRADEQVWVSTTSVTYLRDRYAIPQELAGNLAVVDAIKEQALQS
ncbi:MAG: DUF302 domain-containing protein [Chloroflexi bacterium]|nr:MAG: DUF302 domain-containing protein [Chloroflexota bacterium]